MAYIDKINKDETDYDLQDSKAARSVDGDTSSHVAEADQLHTSSGVLQDDSFRYRTSAGDASISNGEASLLDLRGNTVQDGHVDEVLSMEATFADSETTASLNEATWRSYVDDSGAYLFTYDGTNWQLEGDTANLSDYGITVSGTVAENDSISVNYVKLAIGTLTTATPTSLEATGFNQYDATAGYAHVIGNNQYRIAGTYTSIGFTETIGGTTTTVTVDANGKFTPEADGYIYVTGASGDILIALVWSGVRDSDPFEAYETSSLTIPTTDANNTNLPTASYGMPSVGDKYDEIDFQEKKYIQRIGHYVYSAENLATVQALGVEYIYDLSDIYYELSDPVTYDLASTVTNKYTVNDFGTEEFIGSSVALGTTIYYGDNLVDKLRNLADIQTIGNGLALTGGELSAAGGGGGAKVLTSADYNWPTNNPTFVALWLMPSGDYRWGTGINVYTNSSKRVSTPGIASVWASNSGFSQILWYSNNNNGLEKVNSSTGDTASTVYPMRFLDTKEVYTGTDKYGVNLSTSSSFPTFGFTMGYNTNNNATGGYSASIALGRGSYVDNSAFDSVALGLGAKATVKGEVNIGTSRQSSVAGYNDTAYRILTGLHDGINNHSAATVAQGNTLSDSAPTTATEGVLGQLYTDTSTCETYQCTAIDTTDPSNPVYTWTKRW